MVFGVIAAASAQGWGSGRAAPQFPAAEQVTVSGSMVVAYGSPALKSGEVTYIVSGINRLIGFVDGLKEGVQVTIEGRSISNPRDNNLKFLRPAKLTFGGKTYDMSPLNPPSGTLRRFSPPAPPAPYNRQPRNNTPQERQRRPNMRSM